MEKTLVKPISQRNELFFLLYSTIGILCIAALLIFLRNREDPEKKLKWYQISAFSELSTLEQGTFSDLYTAAYDVELFHLNNKEVWPEVSVLDGNTIAPFTKDAVWGNRGHLSWNLLSMDKDNVHRAIYYGKTADPMKSGSFLLSLEHFHTMDGAYFYGFNKKQPFSVWYKSGTFTLPREITEGTLITSGWRQAIPYKGTDELKKLNRAK